MIAKNIKGKSFKGCVSYVMHEGATLLEAEGVLTDTTKDIIRSFAMQRSGRKEIKQPVGHIPLSFSPEDKERLTDEFMVQLAKEYMQEMGIKNTQYIIVRHNNTDNPHLHIVYNRIDNDLKLISVNHDYKRNIKVCKKLKDRHGLTYGEGKEKVKREKLNDPDKVKYKIYDAIKAVLPQCKNPNDLKSLLSQSNIETEFKLKRTTGEIEGISFRQGDISFKGSQVDRKFSYANLKKEFDKNKIAQEMQAKKVEQEATNKPKTGKLVGVGGIKFTPEQKQTLEDGGYIYLENMQLKDGSNVSAYLFFDDQMNQPFYTRNNPESFVKYGKYEMRLMDKIRIDAGFVTHATVKWYGIGNYAHPHLWKENTSDAEYKESWGDPRLPKEEKVEKKPDLYKNIKINRGRKR
ncbi:relaxase/mobilization nuclease domain-containing protein [Dysgonomonas termitidis]|uniref:Relaxase/mobilization nuclease domain-containing protein n=1 Tax=Dysgonomonas termitidis TaxID=1516126 RepID=A0ABV9L4H8_9BACT|nr:hypothetical protein FACS1894169_06640 [Bacteroidia bacterium]